MTRVLNIALIAICVLVTFAKEDFTGHQVWRFEPNGSGQFQILLDIAEKLSLDVWKIASKDNHIDIRLTPEQQLLMGKIGIDHSVYVEDVQSNINKEMEPFTGNVTQFGLKDVEFFTQYHSFAENVAYIEDLASKYSRASTQVIGTSIEGRDLVVLKIEGTGSNRKSVYVEGTIHAREWITTPSVLYLATQILENTEIDPVLKSKVDSIDWYILPVSNPDGFEFSRLSNRLWRKNRRVNQGTTARGVDLNRNFGYRWNTGGSSSNPSSDTYHGTGPFSEPETDNVQKFVSTLPNFAGFVDVHAYGQYWLYPWGYTTSTRPADDVAMRSCAIACVNAIKGQPEAKTYTYGNSAILLYVASGGADDWGYGAAGGVYSYTLELRDTGRYGFNLPASEILPTSDEIWAAMQVYAQNVVDN